MNEESPTIRAPTHATVVLSYEERSILFKALEQCNWEGVINRLNTNPEEAHVWQEKIIPEKSIRRCLLPIHAAINLDAPRNVIFALLNAYRGAVKCQDDKGDLPLHLIMRKETFDQDLIDAMLDLYPNCYAVKNCEGRMPISIYNQGATKLFRFLESKNWDNTIQRLELHPCEASIWIFRYEKNGELRWRLTPLHVAIIYSAPFEVVAALLKIDSGLVQKKDDQGMLPIHLAFRGNATEKVFNLLFNAYPKGIIEKDNSERTPIMYTQSISSDRKGIIELYAATAIKVEGSRMDNAAKMQYESQIQELKSGIMTKENEYKSEIARLKEEMNIMKRELTRFQKIEASRRNIDGVMMNRQERKHTNGTRRMSRQVEGVSAQ